MPNLQDQIKSAISEKSISAYQLAKDTGINEGQLSRFFNNKVDLSLKKVIQIIDYLGYDLLIQPRKQP